MEDTRSSPPRPLPQAARPAPSSLLSGASSAGVEQFEQTGNAVSERVAGTTEGAKSLASELDVEAMEHQLSQVEADPAALLRLRFLLQEQRLVEEYGGYFHEARPW